MRLAWPDLSHSFSVGGYTSKTEKTYPHGRLPPHLLHKHPVDVLVVEQGSITRPDNNHQVINHQEAWETLIDQTAAHRRPKVVIEAWPDSATTWKQGPMSKAP